MCTVTVVSAGGQVRLAANRDELRSRPEAMPPAVRHFGLRRAILPVDPVGGGTWIAVNDASLAMTVLNVTLAPGDKMTPAPRLSRGAIIPALLSCAALSHAIERALALDAAGYAPFRLVLVDHREAAELRSDGAHLRLTGRSALTAPQLFTSSGLGDALVEGPRRTLFAECFSSADTLIAAQDRYHTHHWPDRPHLSVRMSRPDACTVSRTVVTLRPKRVSLAYRPDAAGRPAGQFVLNLDLPKGDTR